MISSFGSKLITFLLVPLYTTVLSTTEYGTIDLITETALLLIPLLTVDIQDAVLRFSIEDKRDGRVISSGLNIALIGSIILTLVLVILKSTKIIKLDWPILLFLFSCYLLGSINNIITLYLKGIDKIPVIMIAGLMNTGVMCGLNIYLLLFVKMGIEGYIISYTGGMFVSILYQIIRGGIFEDYNIEIDCDLTKEMVRYSSPLVANVIAWWVNSASDRYILLYIRGLSAIGAYAISYKIPGILSTVQTVFYNAWSISAITEYDKNDKDGFIGNTYTLYSLVCVLSCSLIMILNIPLARILYSKDFFEAWRFVPFLLVGTTFNGIALFQGCIFTATKQTTIISRTTVIGAVVNTIGNVVFIYLFGPIGAAFSTMIGYITTWGARLISLRRVIKMKVNWFKHLCSLGIIVLQSSFAISERLYRLQIVCLAFLILMYLRNTLDITHKVYVLIKKRIERL